MATGHDGVRQSLMLGASAIWTGFGLVGATLAPLVHFSGGNKGFLLLRDVLNWAAPHYLESCWPANTSVLEDASFHSTRTTLAPSAASGRMTYRSPAQKYKLTLFTKKLVLASTIFIVSRGIWYN